MGLCIGNSSYLGTRSAETPLIPIVYYFGYDAPFRVSQAPTALLTLSLLILHLTLTSSSAQREPSASNTRRLLTPQVRHNPYKHARLVTGLVNAHFTTLHTQAMVMALPRQTLLKNPCLGIKTASGALAPLGAPSSIIKATTHMAIGACTEKLRTRPIGGLPRMQA